MKKITSLIIFMVLIITFLNAEKTGSQDDVCIWKIESDSNTVYLMGSIHLLPKSDYPLPNAFYTTLEDAENVVFELNYDSVETAAFQQYTILKALCPEGETFKSMVSDSIYNIAQEKSLALGLPFAQLQQFEPWFVAVTMLSMKLQQSGFDPNLGIDMHFFNRSKDQGKTILAFESPEYQMDLLESLGGTDQEDFFLKTITELDEMDSTFVDLVNAWKSADLQKLNELMNAGFNDYPEIKQSLLLDRNYAWLDKIVEYTDDSKDYLIIVGSGHLAGNEGLVNLLKNKGYDVEQVRKEE